MIADVDDGKTISLLDEDSEKVVVVAMEVVAEPGRVVESCWRRLMTMEPGVVDVEGGGWSEEHCWMHDVDGGMRMVMDVGAGGVVDGRSRVVVVRVSETAGFDALGLVAGGKLDETVLAV